MKSISASIIVFAGAGLVLGGGFVPHACPPPRPVRNHQVSEDRNRRCRPAHCARAAEIFAATVVELVYCRTCRTPTQLGRASRNQSEGLRVSRSGQSRRSAWLRNDFG